MSSMQTRMTKENHVLPSNTYIIRHSDKPFNLPLLFLNLSEPILGLDGSSDRMLRCHRCLFCECVGGADDVKARWADRPLFSCS